MFLYLLQKNKWKSEDDTTWEMKTGLETGAKQCLEKKKENLKQNKNNKTEWKRVELSLQWNY